MTEFFTILTEYYLCRVIVDGGRVSAGQVLVSAENAVDARRW
jgi:hypothetical protein